jgi:hypothetical protein
MTSWMKTQRNEEEASHGTPLLFFPVGEMFNALTFFYATGLSHAEKPFVPIFEVGVSGHRPCRFAL